VEAGSCFTISHGKSVSIGMAIVSRASHCPDLDRILGILVKFGLPTTTEASADTLYRYALSDKKRSGGTVNLVIPRRIGDCAIVPTPVDKLSAFIEEGL
jgi:3-dehydroquinate synthase